MKTEPANRSVWRAAFVAAGLLFAFSSTGRAADWFIGSQLSTTGSYDDNLNLQPVSRGDVFGLLSSLSLDILAKNPTSELGLSSNVTYRDYTPAWADDQSGGLQSNSTLSFVKRSKLTDLTLSASISRQNANSSELADTGIVTTDVTRLNYATNAGLTHRIDHRNSVSWTGSASMVDFIGPSSALTPSQSASTSASWHYKGTKRTEARTTLGASWFAADNPAKNRSLTYTATAGVDSQLIKRLSFDGEAGVRLVESTTTDLTTAAMRRKSVITLGYTANASLTYAMKRTSFTITAAHDASPGSLGDLQTRTSVGFQATHAINDLESLSLLTSYSELTQGASSGSSGASARKLLTISPSYSYRMTRDLRADLSYKFAQVDSLAGTATSNSVMLTVSRDFVILP